MKRIYNKGWYRCMEWGKHLRPYQKARANRRWRKHADKLMEQDLFGHEKISPFNRKRRPVRNKIEVEFEVKFYRDDIYKRTSKYKSLRAAQDAMRRKNVVRARIIS